MPTYWCALSGLYGNAAPLTDVLASGLGVIARSKDYALLDLPEVKAVLAHPPEAQRTHPESGTYRALYDCLAIALTSMGPRVRLIVATHAASSTSASLGKQRDGLVYELFVTQLPSPAFSPQDVLDVYLHRGHLKPCWLMKTRSKIPIVGVPVPLLDRNFGRSSESALW